MTFFLSSNESRSRSLDFLGLTFSHSLFYCQVAGDNDALQSEVSGPGLVQTSVPTEPQSESTTTDYGVISDLSRESLPSNQTASPGWCFNF